jgi:transcriptional regulator with XRE-family HTH domain
MMRSYKLRIATYFAQLGFDIGYQRQINHHSNNKSLSRYELGTSIPPAYALKSIADALEVSADALLSDNITSIKDKELFKKV